MRIQFEIPGKPMGKGRARFASRGGKPATYTPAKTVQYENLVKLAFREVAPGHVPWEGAVDIEVTAYFPIPTSRPKWWKEAVRERAEPVTTRPDADNILKVICDALNGIAWEDDRQVSEAYIRKVYAERPRVVVTIEDAARATRPVPLRGRKR